MTKKVLVMAVLSAFITVALDQIGVWDAIVKMLGGEF